MEKIDYSKTAKQMEKDKRVTDKMLQAGKKREAELQRQIDKQNAKDKKKNKQKTTSNFYGADMSKKLVSEAQEQVKQTEKERDALKKEMANNASMSTFQTQEPKRRNEKMGKRQKELRVLRKLVNGPEGVKVLDKLNKATEVQNQWDDIQNRYNKLSESQKNAMQMDVSNKSTPSSQAYMNRLVHVNDDMDKAYDFISQSMVLKEQHKNVDSNFDKEKVEKNMKRLAAQEFFNEKSPTEESLSKFNQLTPLEALNMAQLKVEGRLQGHMVDVKRLDQQISAINKKEIPPSYSDFENRTDGVYGNTNKGYGGAGKGVEGLDNDAFTFTYVPKFNNLVGSSSVIPDTLTTSNKIDGSFEKQAAVDKEFIPNEQSDEPLANTSSSIDKDVLEKMNERIEQLSSENEALRAKLENQAESVDTPKTKKSIFNKFKINRDKYKDADAKDLFYETSKRVGGGIVKVSTITASAILTGTVVFGRYGAKLSNQLANFAEKHLHNGLMGGFDNATRSHMQQQDMGR